MGAILKWLVIVLVVLGVAAGVALRLVAPRLNTYTVSGALVLPALDQPVTVRRDEKGMPYITAQTLQDALVAQGFVTGQDRLFQMEAARRAASGRLSEVFGDATRQMDVEARVIGFRRLAEAQVDLLAPAPRARLAAYVDGLNAVVAGPRNQHPLEMRLLGLEPEPFTPVDIVAIAYLAAWGNAANFNAELVMQAIIDKVGVEQAGDLAPLVINPDVEPVRAAAPRDPYRARDHAQLDLDLTGSVFGAATPRPAAGGSNNWASDGRRSGAGAAVVANDPHLDPRSLPGFWHPIGIATPNLRVVGVSGSYPGVLVGRNQDIAFGVTNAYGDMIDLYIERPDPADPRRYLEGETSRAFAIRTETLSIKDETAPDGLRQEQITIRSTRRGPVISDHGLTAGASDALVSLRWAAAEAATPDFGVDEIWLAKSVDEALRTVERTKVIALNVVVGDATGRIGRRASGAVPIRVRGDGSAPLAVIDSADAWDGFISGADMPGEIDPPGGWTGTANHYTATPDLEPVYSTYTSASYRYRRMKMLFDGDHALGPEELGAAQYDVFNVLAMQMTPLLLAAWGDDPETAEFADILASWSYEDRIDSPAPTIFQAVQRAYARAIVEDELGPDLARQYLDVWYLWQERIGAMTQAGVSPWFDDMRTPETETRDDLMRRAAAEARAELTQLYGPSPAAWDWGKVHQARFQGPLRQTGLAGRLTGAQAHPKPGSGETLDRALYLFSEPYDPRWMASMRMVADLADTEKVAAVLGGGVTGRTFHPHLDDQLEPWMSGAPSYWWFSEDAIAANTRSTLTLTPTGDAP